MVVNKEIELAEAPKVVLLVEDDPNIQEIYSTILKSGGFDVTNVINGKDALAHIEDSKPEFVLLDLMIPGMPGIEVLKNLRTNPKYQAITPQPKIIIITNVADPKMAATAKEYGVDRYIIKAEISASDLPEILKAVALGQPETKK